VKTIVWDVDDVLNGLMRAWFERSWLPQHPDSVLTYQDLRENPPHRVLNISSAEYLHSIDEFRATVGPQLELAPAVLAWFTMHGDKFRHAALTTVPLRAADLWAGWVIKHLGRWIRSFNFVPSPRQSESLPAYDQTKQDFLSWWGPADILVDDNVATIDAAREAGLQVILAPQPWNQAPGSLSDSLDALTGLA
jgi:hypothetical protein